MHDSLDQRPSPSEPVEAALRAGGSTAELFLALVSADVHGDWSRIELLTKAPERVAVTDVADAEPALDSGHGYRLTRTAVRAVTLAHDIAADYDLGPTPPGALVLGLVASMDTAVSAALRLGREADRDRFATLVQEELLGDDLEGLDLTARWVRSAHMELGDGGFKNQEPTRRRGPEPVEDGIDASRTPSSRSGRPSSPAKSPAWPPGLWRTARWGLLAAAVLVGVALIGVLTAPRPDSPGPPAHRLLLSDEVFARDLGGSGFGALPGQARRSVTAPGPTGGRAHCTDSARRWARGTVHVLIEIRRCESFVRAANRHARGERELLAAAVSSTRPGNVPHALLTHGIERTTVTAPYTAILFRRGQYIVHVRAASTKPDPAVGDRLVLDLAQRQWRAIPGTPGGPLEEVPARALSPRIVAWTAALGLGVLLVANLFATARSRRLNPVSRWPLDLPGLTWVDVSSPAWKLAYEAQTRFWVFCCLAAVIWVLPLPPLVSAIAFGVCVNQLALSTHFQPGRHRLWGRHSAPQIKLRARANRRPIAITGRALQLLALPAISMIAISIVLAPYGYLSNLGRFDPVVVADSSLSRPIRLMPVPVVLLALAFTTIALWWIARVLQQAAWHRHPLSADRLRRIDPRPPVLYLRNGGDDELTIRTSPPARRSLFDKLRANQFEPFEEVIIRFLAAYGPVIALRHPHAPPAPIGTVRANTDGDWEPLLRQYIRESCLIVVGAAPQTYGPALHREMDEIIQAGALHRTILVLPPRLAGDVRQNWRQFREKTPIDVPEGIDTYSDRTLAVHSAPSTGWVAVHAGRRSDWAYGVALSQLADQITASSRNLPVHGP